MLERSASADTRLASSGPKIFISYRTREHAEYVEPLAVALSNSGFTVLLDRQQDLEEARFGPLDLPLAGGLALELRSLLRAADVAVVLVSNGPQEKSGRQRLRERLDLLLLEVVYAGNTLTRGIIYRFVAGWEKHWYDIDTTKRLDESWQAWEQRVTEAIGVPIMFVAIPDGPVNSAVTEARADGAVVLEHARLEEQVETLLAPGLRELVGTRKPLERSAEKEREFRWLRRMLIVVLVLSAPFIAVARLTERVTEPFLRFGELLRAGARGVLRRGGEEGRTRGDGQR